jgi:hypothetical protein
VFCLDAAVLADLSPGMGRLGAAKGERMGEANGHDAETFAESVTISMPMKRTLSNIATRRW